MEENTQYEAGEVIILTSGDYSDYTVVDAVKVLKPFNSREYLLAHPKAQFSEICKTAIGSYQQVYLSSPDGFIASLIQDGYIEPFTYRLAHEWYSTTMKDNFRPRKEDYLN